MIKGELCNKNYFLVGYYVEKVFQQWVWLGFYNAIER